MKKNILALAFTLSLIMSACGGNSASEEDLAMASTAAAQTVEARFTEKAAESTSTPEPQEDSVAPPVPTFTAMPTETPASDVPPAGCLVATFVSENLPDLTVYETGQVFTKSWTIRNDGTCTWDKGYKLIYWDGDIMGGSTVYDFFDITAPGETMTLPIQLLTPDQAGNYEGFWKMMSTSGYVFGIGEYNSPVSVKVDVRDPDDIEYGVTSVVYSLEREPAFGCPANVFWTINADITVSGRMYIVAQFKKSDGTHTPKETIFFDEAGTKRMSMTWSLYKGAGPAPRWGQIVVFKPDYQVFEEFVFKNNCPDVVD